MRNRVIALGTLVVAILGIAVFTATQANAYKGDPTQVGPNHTQEREAELNRIFEDKDYDAWVDFMTENDRHPGVLDKIDEENFDGFVKAREMAKEGNLAEANKIREELGLGTGEGKMNRNGNGEGQGRMERDGNCNR